MAVTKLSLPDWMIHRWWKVAYKILPPLAATQREFVEIQPNAAFEQMVSKHTRALLEEGTQPPAEIAVPILNLAGQIMNGHEITMGVGDYITLQTFAKKSVRR